MTMAQLATGAAPPQHTSKVIQRDLVNRQKYDFDQTDCCIILSLNVREHHVMFISKFHCEWTFLSELYTIVY